MNDIIAAQRRYFNSGATRNTDFRRRMLARLEEAVRRHEAELLAALKTDLNKTAFEGLRDRAGPGPLRAAGGPAGLDRWARPRRLPTPLSQFLQGDSSTPSPTARPLLCPPGTIQSSSRCVRWRPP